MQKKLVENKKFKAMPKQFYTEIDINKKYIPSLFDINLIYFNFSKIKSL
jgi:hypothetical protein